MAKRKTENNLKDLILDGSQYKTQFTDAFTNRKPYQPVDLTKVYAVIPGTIVKVQVKEGQKINPGRNIFILEAMKMKNRIFSEVGGLVSKIHVQEGDVVMKNQLLMEFAGPEETAAEPVEKRARTIRRSRKSSPSGKGKD